MICGIFQIFKRDECVQVTGLNALMDDSKKWMFPGTSLDIYGWEAELSLGDKGMLPPYG